MTYRVTKVSLSLLNRCFLVLLALMLSGVPANSSPAISGNGVGIAVGQNSYRISSAVAEACTGMDEVGPSFFSIGPGKSHSATCVVLSRSELSAPVTASISGQVRSFMGSGLRGARLTLYNADTDVVIATITNHFGYYRFRDQPVSDFYILTVSHKSALFLDASRGFTLEEDILNMNFAESPPEELLRTDQSLRRDR
jgi:hypothetical protein